MLTVEPVHSTFARTQSHTHTLSHLQTATKIVRLTTNVVDDKLVEVAVRCLLSNACFSPFSTTRAQILSNFHAYIWTLHSYTQIQMRKCTYSLTYLHTYAGCTCVYHLLFSPSLHGQLLAEKFNLSAVDVSQYAVYDHRDNGG